MSRKRTKVVCCSVNMAVGNAGTENCCAMNGTDRGTGTIPAISLTAHARTEDRIKALSSGFNSHVPKPIESAEFITVVTNLIHRL